MLKKNSLEERPSDRNETSFIKRTAIWVQSLEEWFEAFFPNVYFSSSEEQLEACKPSVPHNILEQAEASQICRGWTGLTTVPVLYPYRKETSMKLCLPRYVNCRGWMGKNEDRRAFWIDNTMPRIAGKLYLLASQAGMFNISFALYRHYSNLYSPPGGLYPPCFKNSSLIFGNAALGPLCQGRKVGYKSNKYIK